MGLLTGCGGGSSSSSGSSTFSSTTVPMDIGTAYDVYPGDQLVKNSETATVTISHVDGNTESTVVLEDGNASIIYR